jgi:hypothetical protein
MFTDSESAESWLARAALLKEKHSNGNGAGMPLAVAVKIADWPTPRASESENRQTKASPSQLAGEHGWSLGAAVNHNWATPRAEFDSGRHRGKADTLHLQIKDWSTPTVNDAQNATAPPSQSERNSEALAVQSGATVAAALNPAWVCRLMGFPDGWAITSGPPAVAKRSTPASPRARRRASQ